MKVTASRRRGRGRPPDNKFRTSLAARFDRSRAIPAAFLSSAGSSRAWGLAERGRGSRWTRSLSAANACIRRSGSARTKQFSELFSPSDAREERGFKPTLLRERVLSFGCDRLRLARLLWGGRACAWPPPVLATPAGTRRRPRQRRRRRTRRRRRSRRCCRGARGGRSARWWCASLRPPSRPSCCELPSCRRAPFLFLRHLVSGAALRSGGGASHVQLEGQHGHRHQRLLEHSHVRRWGARLTGGERGPTSNKTKTLFVFHLPCFSLATWWPRWCRESRCAIGPRGWDWCSSTGPRRPKKWRMARLLYYFFFLVHFFPRTPSSSPSLLLLSPPPSPHPPRPLTRARALPCPQTATV